MFPVGDAGIHSVCACAEIVPGHAAEARGHLVAEDLGHCLIELDVRVEEALTQASHDLDAPERCHNAQVLPQLLVHLDLEVARAEVSEDEVLVAAEELEDVIVAI